MSLRPVDLARPRLWALNVAIVALQGGDAFGVSRTVDHAVYTLLNAVAVILWRLNAAIISMSMFGYATQDWLTNRHDGGVWHVLGMIAGPDGFAGETVWAAMLALALALFGLSRVARPFMRHFNPVDLGKLLMFGVLSYAVIQQGSGLMIDIEAWRTELGGWMYEGVAASAAVNIDAPDTSGSGEPMYPPRELDGQPPIRGWEAVASSYFLTQSEAELNSNIPPPDFRRAYCLYDPDQSINDQAAENDQGCSPRKAWDEWDLVSTGVITEVWGIELPVAVGISLPITQEHPENRELGIRQAQAGVARLALGPLVALYPVLEANISLMLALSAAILYLTLPIMLLFGFFVTTEPLVRQLLLRVVSVMLNTIILNGLIALFLLLLMNASLNGSLTGYLGVVGVAVIGGIILSRVAAGTLKETMSAAMSAVGGAWLGATTAAMGPEAAAPARGVLGAAKLAGMGALVGAAGMSAFDLAEPALHGARSGLRDLDSAAPGTEAGLQQKAGRLPAPLAKMVQSGLDTRTAAGGDPGQSGVTWPASEPGANGSNGQSLISAPEPGQGNRLLTGGAAMSASQANGANGFGSEPPPSGVEQYSQAERLAVWQTGIEVAARPEYRQAADGTLNVAGLNVAAEQLNGQGYSAFQGETGRQALAMLMAAQADSHAARGWGAPEERRGRVDSWLETAYRARESGPGQAQASEAGRSLFGEALGRDMETAVVRHSRPEAENVMRATRQAALTLPPAAMMANGELTDTGRAAIRTELGEAAMQSFTGPRGYQDLEALATAALQRDMTAGRAAFYRQLATAESWELPAETVPARLGLDPVAAGPHYSSLNRFSQVSEAAGLTPALREQLLTEANRETGVSPALEAQISAALARQVGRGQGQALDVAQVIDSARAVPPALSGPQLRGGGAVVPERNTTPAAGVTAGRGSSMREESRRDDDREVSLPVEATDQAGASAAALRAIGAVEERSGARELADQLRSVVNEVPLAESGSDEEQAPRGGRAITDPGIGRGLLNQPETKPERPAGQVDDEGIAAALQGGGGLSSGISEPSAGQGTVNLNEPGSLENPNSAGPGEAADAGLEQSSAAAGMMADAETAQAKRRGPDEASAGKTKGPDDEPAANTIEETTVAAQQGPAKHRHNRDENNERKESGESDDKN